MADEIDVLLGGGMTPDNTETEMMAAALRGQMREGDVLGMSTISPVAQYGKQQAKAARQGAKQAGQLKQSLEKEARRKAEMAEQEERRSEQALDKEARAFKEWEKKQARTQQDRMDFAQFKQDLLKTNAPEDDNKLKPTGKAVQDYVKSRQLSNLISSVNTDFGKMSKEQVDMLDNPRADVATEMFLPASLERYVQDEFLYDDPQVKNYRAKIADVESEFSRLMSGLAVTGFEMTDRQKWSPFASGIGQDTRNARLKNLQDKLSGQQDLSEKTYRLGNIANTTATPEGVEETNVDIVEEPEKTVTMAELQAMGATPQEAQAAGYKVTQ